MSSIWYLMREGDEKFFTPCTGDADAMEAAAMWNAVVVRRASKEETKDLTDYDPRAERKENV
tara:strand:- start:8026 stop:8211 length:186 start_codon:yes stop_codon:yes gene_type:complete